MGACCNLSRLIQNYGDVFSVNCGSQTFIIVELGKQSLEIAAVKVYLTRDAILPYWA